jgi:hypothetical protein
MLLAEFPARRKMDGFNLYVRVSEEDANANHYNNIFFKLFTEKNYIYNQDDNEFIFYEMEGNALYKYLYILNKFVLKCNGVGMRRYKNTMKILCQKKLVKANPIVFTKDSFTQDYYEEDIPIEIKDEFSYLFTNIKDNAIEPVEEESTIEPVDEESTIEPVEEEPVIEDDEESTIEPVEEEPVIEDEEEPVIEKDDLFEAEKQSLKEQRDALKIEKQVLQEQRNAFEAEKQSLKEYKTTLEESLKKKQTALEICLQELAESKAAFEAKKRQFEQATNEGNVDLEREIVMLRQKLEFYSNNDDEHQDLRTEYTNLLSDFEEYKEATEKQIEELKQYEPVDLSLYTKPDNTELVSLFEDFEKKMEKLLVNSKDTSGEVHRMRGTITSLEMENTELRKENDEIYEKLAFCEKQFELIKHKYIKLQQLKHKYKTLAVNTASTNHIDELPFISRRAISPIPDEPVRHPYRG